MFTFCLHLYTFCSNVVNMSPIAKYPVIRVRESDMKIVRRIAKSTDLKYTQVLRMALRRLEEALRLPEGG